VSSIVSSSAVARVSSMFLFVSDVAGGIYTFTTFILWLFGRMIFVCRPYSFPLDASICSGLRTYVASPPLVLSVRRCSITVKPSIIGAAAPSAIHVSYKHSISISCCSSRRSSLR
jgi:hypothetical protein